MKSASRILALLPLFAFFPMPDNTQLALDIYNAEAANNRKLTQFIWERESKVYVNNELKMTANIQMMFDDSGKLKTKVIDTESTVKAKPGIRGNMQEKEMQEKADYVEKALELSIAYAYMSKGQTLDFVEKSKVSDNGTTIDISGQNIFVKGDQMKVQVDSKSKLYNIKEFSSLIGKDPISGKIYYEKFASNGINHVTKTELQLPAQNMRIEAVNQNYSQRVK